VNVKPESIRQAQRWDVVKTRYVNAGLCGRCAAQAAWGHQSGGGGWDTLHQPCRDCAPVVSALPEPTINPQWRKFDRPQVLSRARVAKTPAKAVEDIDVPLNMKESVML